MSYNCDWNVTLKGRGKLLPLTDIDSIIKMFQAFITALQNAGHEIDLDRTHINFDKIEESQ